MVIYASERPGGFGGKDLYASFLQPDSTWGASINLGDKINTPYDDDAPFLHPDGKTMIFSSKGYNSMGGFDIFRAEMSADSSWALVDNLGYPINTPDDDIYYVLSPDGKRGYYASGKDGGLGLQDVYMITPGMEGFNPIVCLLSGTTTKNKSAVQAEIEIFRENGISVQKLNSKNYDGKYLVNLQGGYEYKIIYKLLGGGEQSRTLDLRGLVSYQERVIDVEFNDTLIAVVKNNLESKPENDKAKSEVKVIEENKDKKAEEKNIVPDVTSKMTKEGLIFKIQIAAYKYPSNYSWPHLKGKGKVEKIKLDDEITRFTIGGEFKNLDEANIYCKSIRESGQPDAFVTAIYNGKRVYLEELEAKGIIPKQN
jgi:hypothetical protein